MKIIDNNIGDISPSATDLLADLKHLATPTFEEEYILNQHKNEIPSILAGLKYGKRICKICGVEKPVIDFAKGNDNNFRHICKKCDNERRNEEKRRKLKEMAEKQAKICTRCGKEKPLDEYQIDRRGKLGRKSICKECANSEKREKRAAIKTCTPQPLRKDFDTENFKRYLMYQIETNKSMITKLQGKIETYQELLGEL